MTKQTIITGKANKWSALEKCETEEGTYYLYESDKYGLELPYIVIKYVDEQPIEIYETYFGILSFLQTEGIIEEA